MPLFYTLSSILHTIYDMKLGSSKFALHFFSGHNLTFFEILFLNSVFVSNVHHKSSNCPSFSFFHFFRSVYPLITWMLFLFYFSRFCYLFSWVSWLSKNACNIVESSFLFRKINKYKKTSNMQFILF